MRRAPLLLPLPLLLASCSGGGAPASAPTAPTSTPLATAPAATAPPVAPVDPLSPAPAVESAAPSPGLPACDARRLSVQDADLLADERRLQEVFAVRTSGAACQLRGWPTVVLERADGSTIPVGVRRTGTASLVTLSRATSVSFVLSTPRSSDCEDVSAVVVRLPGTNRPLRTATTMQVCQGRLEVGPVERRGDVD